MAEEASPSQVNLEKQKSKACVIKITEIEKAIDIDGDGKIDEDEQKILNTLKAMDVDGDGNISLKELVNIGKTLNVQQDQTKLYKRLFWGLLLLSFLACCATFLACLAAVEAAKDNRPDKDGTLKTVVTAGQGSKVIKVGEHYKTVAMSDLHKASYDALRGVTDLGFKLSNRFYQYTVTGFEQEFNQDGTASVRFYSSRGDTIFVSSTEAKLEKPTGSIDIRGATTKNRHLLSLSSMTQDLDAGSVISKTADDVNIANLDAAAIKSIADDAAQNDPNGTLSPSSGAIGLKQNAECPKNSSKVGDADPNCKCNTGFASTTEFSFDVATEKFVGQCDLAPQASGTSCWYNDYPGMGGENGHVTCECPNGYIGAVTFIPEGTWMSKCKMAALPSANNVTLVVETMAGQGYFEPRLNWTYISVTCPQGYSGNFWWDYQNEEWKGEKCSALSCPEGSVRADEGGQAICKCAGLYAGSGYEFKRGWFNPKTTPEMEAEGTTWKAGCGKVFCPWGSSQIEGTETCKCDKVGTKNEVLNIHRPNATEWKWPMFVASYLGGKQEPRDMCAFLDCPVNSHKVWKPPTYDQTCECDNGYKGAIRWGSNSSQWLGACHASQCPAGTMPVPPGTDMSTIPRGDAWGPLSLSSLISTAPGAPMCMCKDGLTGQVMWDEAGAKFMSTCVPKPCPEGTVKVNGTRPLQTPNGTKYYPFCDIRVKGYRGYAVYEPDGFESDYNSMSISIDGAYHYNATEVKCPPSIVVKNGTNTFAPTYEVSNPLTREKSCYAANPNSTFTYYWDDGTIKEYLWNATSKMYAKTPVV